MLWAAALALALLAGCGGGGGAGGSPAGGAGEPDTSAEPAITLSAMTAPNYTAADCPRFVNEADARAALDLSNAQIRTVNDFLLALDEEHAYKVFLRRPYDFINWIANSSGGTLDLLSLGAATHETMHMNGWVLEQCGTAGTYKNVFLGILRSTSLRPGDTPSMTVVGGVIDPALKAEPRYDVYITKALVGNDFTVLLDEFAAYAGAAQTDLLMIEAHPAAHKSRADLNLGGTVNFMVYLQNYLKAIHGTSAWDKIKNDAAAVAYIQAVWNQAEKVLADSYVHTQDSATTQLVINAAYFAAAYSTALLSELDAIGVTHRSAASWSGTYLP